eukprot:CAMPEP_0197831694 /NCGR_PEP_ID=MMETSP1437-20131217/11575_1 /TAXON_ID=49252 ORGANISM="Eucampia antarctica, Strain CCMP1452" /NCGR_SAMPLE_ID=MMETSP1437 /ASSEMBLY_ACC=CAM_ASM_001096 /LENGTH=316 /DNA_ID=CAMNT_0043434719 /DNA_START=18 /DNA_END=968 /DNA_ORIENTATION=-
MMQVSSKCGVVRAASFLICALVTLQASTNAFQPQLSNTANFCRPSTVVNRNDCTTTGRSVVGHNRLNGGASVSTKTSTKLHSQSKSIDTDAILKYGTAAVVQMSIFSTAFYLLDQIVGVSPLTQLPAPAVGFLFYFFSLKSRIFNPLNNKRPKRDKLEEGSDGFRDRVMPSWTPPGVVFPIMWVLIIGPARAYSASLIFQANGHHLFDPALLSFVFHLTIGDIWNTINNTEKRYGAAVIGILCVVASAAFAATQYYQVDPLAGKILGATLLWLTTASALIADTWRLNPNPDGDRDPLYPVKGEAETSFLWFASSEE